MADLDSEAPNGTARWLILVAAEQAELYAHLREALRGDKLIEVVLDRRKNPARTPAWLREQLRLQGAALIPRQS
ncbi:MAG TPA: hypothetical protein VMS64_07825 [Candidatus Methylomirabilis sp.]|nr:hypothetical protein [Candidatus Methylomirabilis sp.]